jgi:hypothetical protein
MVVVKAVAIPSNSASVLLADIFIPASRSDVQSCTLENVPDENGIRLALLVEYDS